jgi:ankyrin repeat protein
MPRFDIRNLTYAVVLVMAAMLAASCTRISGRSDSLVPNSPAVNTTASVGPNDIDERGVSRLLDAVNTGNIEGVRALLEAGANPNATNVARSPLVSAITEFDGTNRRLVCNIDIVRLLLEHGADPNMRDPSVDTLPIHKAMELGEINCAKLLKDYGARVAERDPAGRTLLDCAVAGAVHVGDMSVIDVPLAWGISANMTDQYGRTALLTAVWLDSAAAVRVLLDRGVDPCVADKRDPAITPLYSARNLRRSSQIIEMLDVATRCNVDDQKTKR